MLAKFIDGQIRFAGGKVIHNGDEVIVNPREEDFIRIGYKEVEHRRKKEKEGYYQVAEYTEEEDKIVANYHYEEITEEEEV